MGKSKSPKYGKCIYCPYEGMLSKEHHLSKALGIFDGYFPLIGKVCIRCNKEVSRFEEQEFRIGLLSHLRVRAGIRASEEERSPFYDRAGGMGPSAMTSNIPGKNEDLLIEIIPGTDKITHRRQVVLKAPDGRIIDRIPVKNWQSQKLDLIKQILSRVPDGFTTIETHHDPEEDFDVRDLVSALGGEIRIGDYRYESGRQTIGVQYDKLLTARVAAKTAFHYMLTQIVHYNGHEEIFAAIKKFIMHGELPNGENILTENNHSIEKLCRRGVNDSEFIHVLSCSWLQDEIRAHCRFFDMPNSQPIAYDFLLARHDRKVIPEPHIFAHRFRYLDLSKQPARGIMEKLAVPGPTILLI